MNFIVQSKSSVKLWVIFLINLALKNKSTLSANDQVIRKSNQYPQMPGRSGNVQILNIQSFNDFDKSNLKSKENVK